MKRVLDSISSWFLQVGLAFRATWQAVLHDVGALIFFIALPLFYPIVYTLIYNPEVVTRIPVAVIDDSRTQASRDLVRMAEAAPSVDIYDYAPNMADAKRMMAEHKVYAIMHIPSDYAKKIARGEQTTVTLVCDMSLLLRYRALLSTMTSLQIDLAQQITATKVSLLGMDSAGNLSGLPINNESHFLGDTQSGFASFIIPGIVVLILQQSMVLGIVLLGSTSTERRRRNRGVDPRDPTRSASASTLGKALCFITFYLPTTIYILHFVPEMFHLPHYGSAADYLLFIFPMLVALVLSEINPERAQQIMQRGYDIGESRVILGFHFDSDARAGSMCASMVVPILYSDPDFLHDLAAAMREINALRSLRQNE